MRVLGMISGTSMDGIDAAVVDFALDGDTLHFGGADIQVPRQAADAVGSTRNVTVGDQRN